MPVILGGPNARKVIQRGDMACAFHYLGPENEETACFFPVVRRKINGVGAYCVPLSAAFQYADPHYLFQAATKAAEVMGFDPMSRIEVYRIMDFLQDMLIELVTLRPAPDALRAAVEAAEVSVRDGKTTIAIH